MFEKALCTVGYCKGIPYWDWSGNSQAWAGNNDIWSWFGSLTNSGCLQNGRFTYPTFKTSVGNPVDKGGPNACLQRTGLANANYAIVDATWIQNHLSSSSNFDTFRGDDSTGYHAAGHVWYVFLFKNHIFYCIISIY
jgi:hypothetical protein